MREKKMLSMYGDLKHFWGREAYTSCCTMKERSPTACFRLEIWKLKEANGDTGKGRFFLCAEDNSESLLFLKCTETQRWRDEVLQSKWLHINEETTIRKVLTVKNATEQRNLGTLAYNIKCERKKQSTSLRKQNCGWRRVGTRMRLYVGIERL